MTWLPRRTADVTIASIRGGAVPIDDASLAPDKLTERCTRFQNDPTARSALENSIPVKDLVDRVSEFDIVFLPGGHGTCTDFEEDENITRVIEAAAREDKVIAAVCHGPIALSRAKAPDGSPLLRGKKVTSFTNAEEVDVGMKDTVPFLLEVSGDCHKGHGALPSRGDWRRSRWIRCDAQDRLKEQSAEFSCGSQWTSHVVRDGRIVTGQNPQSSVDLALKCLEAAA